MKFYTTLIAFALSSVVFAQSENEAFEYSTDGSIQIEHQKVITLEENALIIGYGILDTLNADWVQINVEEQTLTAKGVEYMRVSRVPVIRTKLSELGRENMNLVYRMKDDELEVSFTDD
ncbi:MAG: hypothetical protein HWE14_09920 [Flavobacteriia bacterium]|nr:hypothetical protein [Flavobacteriia bacterium]